MTLPGYRHLGRRRWIRCSALPFFLLSPSAGNAFGQEPNREITTPPVSSTHDSKINERTSPAVVLQLPLIREGRPAADITAQVSPDGNILYERESITLAMRTLIDSTKFARFIESLPDDRLVAPAQLVDAGLTLRYNPSRLEVVIERLDPSLVSLSVLGTPLSSNEIPITIDPEEFSAYLNIIGDIRVTDFEALEEPGAVLVGAVRIQNLVLEFDGGYDPQLTGGSGLYRRQARAVYDERDKARRWTAGDLQLFGGNLLGGALIGGVALERGRRIFTGLAPVQPLGIQQLLIERDATIEVFVDGQQAETLQVTAGPYEVGALISRYGGRDVELFVTDVSGRRQVAGLDTFFDPSDLARGESEYSLGVGFVARDFRAQPIYGGMPAFSGYYRRGMSNRLVLGGALQVSEDLQTAAIELIATPNAIPGRFEIGAAISTADNFGYAARGAYSVFLNRGPHARQLSLSADFRSSSFATLVDQIGFRRSETLNVTGSFSQSLSEKTTLLAGFNLFRREDLPTTRRAFVDVVHRFENIRVTAGVEYGSGIFEKDFGVRVAVSVPLGGRSRVQASYNSRRDDFRAFASRAQNDQVGSWGYDVGVGRTADNAIADGTISYVGNRFFTRLSASTAGPNLSNINDRQFARLQIGTSLAYAGGSLAIGRPIADSFVIADPHPALAEEQVIIGQSVHEQGYQAVSGAFGPALGSRLSSYSRQNVIYDLLAGAGGYDIGPGIHRVDPPYRSGYKIVVGTDATVTAFGVLNLPSGRAELVSGTITGIDDPDFLPQPFFTNSVGRYAIIGLRPGRAYEVTLFDPVATFRIDVPDDSDPLLRLGETTITLNGKPQE